MLRAIIIDDEEAAIEMLKILAERNADRIRIINSTSDAEEGIRMIEDYQPDVVFLDISMPVMSGFDLLQKLSNKSFMLVFTTAHKEFALQAIKNRASDYLLKPVDAQDIKNCIETLYDTKFDGKPKSGSSQPLLQIQVKDGIIYLRQNDIIRVEADRSYTEFFLEGGVKHVASKSLKEFEGRLDADIFYRCHNSHIINLKKVEKFINHEGFFALMCDGSKVDISKKNKDQFLERLKAM